MEGLGFVAEAGAGFEGGGVVVGVEEFDDDFCVLGWEAGSAR